MRQPARFSRPLRAAFAYFGRDHQSLEDAIAAWCSERKCSLETTALLEGATFRISGPDDTVGEAMKRWCGSGCCGPAEPCRRYSMLKCASVVLPVRPLIGRIS